MNPINDIGDAWRDHKEIAGSLWVWSERAETGYQGIHGQFIPQVAQTLITRYTHKDDLVIDLFAGGGTALFEAQRMGRYAIGVDIRKDAVDALKACPDPRVRVLCADSACYTARDVVWQASMRLVGRCCADLTILHPPYLDVIKFSESDRDLSNMDADTFLSRWVGVCYTALDVTRVGGWVALVIGDVYKDGRLIPLGFECMDALCGVGLTLKAINVKNITGNEKGAGNPGLWSYRALTQGYSVFQHEYIMLFRREK